MANTNRLNSDNSNGYLDQNLDSESCRTDDPSLQLDNRLDERIPIRFRQNLKVIIVGGGIGGLSAALALRKQGHDVDVGRLVSPSVFKD